MQQNFLIKSIPCLSDDYRHCPRGNDGEGKRIVEIRILEQILTFVTLALSLRKIQVYRILSDILPLQTWYKNIWPIMLYFQSYTVPTFLKLNETSNLEEETNIRLFYCNSTVISHLQYKKFVEHRTYQHQKSQPSFPFLFNIKDRNR